MQRNCSKEDSCGSLGKQEINPDSKDVQNRFTEHLGSFDSLQILQEDNKETESNTKGKNSYERKVDQSKRKISDPLSLSRFKTGRFQSHTDASRLHKNELISNNKNQLKPSSMILLSLLLMLTVNSSSTMMYANAK